MCEDLPYVYWKVDQKPAT